MSDDYDPIPVERTLLEEKADEFFRRVQIVVDQAIAAAQWTNDDVDWVFPVGGGLRVPKIVTDFEDRFS